MFLWSRWLCVCVCVCVCVCKVTSRSYLQAEVGVCFCGLDGSVC